MHKRLLNRPIIKRLSHQRFVNHLTRNYIFQRRGVQNFCQEENGNFHAKLNTFLFRIFRPFQLNKYYKYSNLQFEFGLPLFILKTLHILPGRHRLEIKPQNNSVTFQQFNIYKYIHTIQKYQPSIIKPKKPVDLFHKYELSLVTQGVLKGYSEPRKPNIPSQKVKPFQTRHFQPKFSDSEFQILKNSTYTHFDRMSITKIFNSMKEQVNRIAPKTSISEDMVSKFSIEGKRESLDPIEIATRDGIILRVKVDTDNNTQKALTASALQDIHRKIANIKPTEAIDILPKTLRFFENINIFQNHYLSTTSNRNTFPVLAVQHTQVQGMKSVLQSVITGDNLPNLVHRKPAEVVNEQNNDVQIAVADQHNQYRMIKPQGIAESYTGNQTVDIGHLTDKFMELFEQRLKTEQERRGIFI